MNKLCCFCKMPVLGIFGQDDLIDTYNLQREEEDQRAVAEGAFGSCHIKCLLSSPWNDFWVKRRPATFMDPRGYRLTHEEEDGRIFRHHRTGGNIVVLASGVLLPLADRTIRSGLPFQPSHSLRWLTAVTIPASWSQRYDAAGRGAAYSPCNLMSTAVGK